METGARQVTSTEITDVTNSRTDTLGTLGAARDARTYRYAKFGGVVAPGQVVVAPALVSGHQNIAVAAAVAAGATMLNVTLGNAAATADQYAGGHMTVGVDGSGQPIIRRIKSNTVGNANATITIVLESSEPLLFPLTTTNVVSLAPGFYNGVTASSTAGVPMGVVVTGGTANQYGWIQTNGPCGVINDAVGTLAALTPIKQSATVAGAVLASSAAADIQIGYMVQSAVASKAALANLAFPGV